MTMALQGIRIVDCTHWHQGPTATGVLADLGAEVIHVEHPVHGDGVRGLTMVQGQNQILPGNRHVVFEVYNRNKRGIAVDLKQEKGREIIYRLVRISDVFVQNMPWVEQWGFDYESLRRINPTLIYAGATPLGPAGPDRDGPGLDIIGLARSGFLMAEGENGQPDHTVPGIADEIGGRLLAFGIVTALLARERLGIGQRVDSSLMGGMIALQNSKLARQLLLGDTFGKQRREEAGNPIYNFYKCKDGRWIYLGLLQSERFWGDFCRAAGRPELEHDERFGTAQDRLRHNRELIQILDELFLSRSYDEWATTLREYSKEFIFTWIANYSDLERDPQVLENRYIVEFDHPVLGRVKHPGSPVTFSETPASIRSPAPELGQHTEEVLTELCGYDWGEIEVLKKEGVIR